MHKWDKITRNLEQGTQFLQTRYYSRIVLLEPFGGCNHGMNRSKLFACTSALANQAIYLVSVVKLKLALSLSRVKVRDEICSVFCNFKDFTWYWNYIFFHSTKADTNSIGDASQRLGQRTWTISKRHEVQRCRSRHFYC